MGGSSLERGNLLVPMNGRETWECPNYKVPRGRITSGYFIPYDNEKAVTSYDPCTSEELLTYPEPRAPIDQCQHENIAGESKIEVLTTFLPDLVSLSRSISQDFSLINGDKYASDCNGL